MFPRVFGVLLCGLIINTLFGVTESQNWSGNLETYARMESRTCRRCIHMYLWGCSNWGNFSCNVPVYANRCLRGWTHNGDYNCTIPICRPDCGPGECTNPDTCDCNGTASGRYCQQLQCSYEKPCYPGYCYDNDKCNCTSGFTKTAPYGCMIIDTNNRPYIGRSTTIIQNIQRTNNRFLFSVLLDGTDQTESEPIVWSHQRNFNELKFECVAKYSVLEPMPERPDYVHDTKVGITRGNVSMRLINYKGEEYPSQQYNTSYAGISQDNPQEIINCTITDEEFIIPIEHADTLNVTFTVENGGYRIINNQGNLQPREYFQGQTATRHVYFKFDFEAPHHCSEAEVDVDTPCGENATLLDVGPEFTKDPITVSWKNWTDDKHGSQMWMYYLELHKLIVKDATLNLTERDPIGPMDSAEVIHMGNVVHNHTFIPKEPGIYSILLEVKDKANNSRIARRFAVYDNVSDVELDRDSPTGLHISTAENHTGFKWQNRGNQSQDTQITVNWTAYFMNRAHADGYYNNGIQPFKGQFQNLEDVGILFSRKFVDPRLDDDEGERTLDPIPSIHGIVEFEYQYSRDVSEEDPPGTWQTVQPLSETTTITEQMNSGDQIKVWVKARDVLGNTKTASTMVTTDFTPPFVSDITDNTTTYMVSNDPTGPYYYSSSFHLEAYDTESGVGEIGLDISMHVPNMPDTIVRKTVEAHTDDTRHPDTDTACVQSKDKSTCFLREQTVYLDNCWLTVPDQANLLTASATVIVRAYNQAMLTSSVIFEIPSISDLAGLEGYTGPESARTENISTRSFRIAWDFPEKMSCYAKQTGANGTIQLEEYKVAGSWTYFDIAGLEPVTKYNLTFQSDVGGIQSEPLELTVQTAALRSMYPDIEPYDTGMLRVSDIHQVYYEQAGSITGNPVIFLHGGPGAGTSPRDRTFFDPKAYRIILMDQRGAGKSTPPAELEENTIWNLVSDIEKLREKLGIEKWVVFGCSWGSTLSLAYTETHPDRVKALILQGIFTLTRREVTWLYQDGASRIFPDPFEDYVKPIPEVERGDLLGAYNRCLTSGDENIQLECANAWSKWEMATSRIYIDRQYMGRAEADKWALQFARIEWHFLRQTFTLFPMLDTVIKKPGTQTKLLEACEKYKNLE